MHSRQCSQPSGAPVGPGGGAAKGPGRDGTANRSPSSSFIPTCRATWENDWMGRQNAVRPRPWISRMAFIRKDDKPHDQRHIPVGDGGDGRWWWVTVGDGPSLGWVGQVPEKTGWDDRMPSVLVFDSYLSGNFRKWPDGTTNCRPSSSWLSTDGLPRCEHW